MKIQPLEFEKPIIELEEKLADIRSHSREHDVDVDAEVRRMEEKIEATRRQIYLNLTPWERVQIARHPARPYTLDYLQLSFSNYVELHGDRLFADDRAMPGGFAMMEDRKCVVIGHQKGRELKENIKRNFGCANPEGLPQGASPHADCGKIQPAIRFAHRHSRRVSGCGLGGTSHLLKPSR
jgi:acetyl-CoA carboxylase carboxyl transferase subunit alpha